MQNKKDISTAKQFIGQQNFSPLFSPNAKKIINAAHERLFDLKPDEIEVEKKINCILLGSLVLVMVIEDEELGKQSKFDNKYMYPYHTKDEVLDYADLDEDNPDIIKEVGTLVLEKKLSFDAERVKEIFIRPHELMHLSEDYFDRFHNPDTTQTSKKLTSKFFGPTIQKTPEQNIREEKKEHKNVRSSTKVRPCIIL